ncbi:Protein bli-3 [Penicillium subrubescens]|jgi:hypothetical protein|uniref:Protein bli-3 n=1 Tax=Penicillium subrubescens TaxID=1316194 RepID=A0A1Q5U1L2_9EURO|nr:Protein bli-3 [Penicillium subrubescens]
MTTNATINTPTGTHSVDPYKTQNAEDPPLPQKVQDLVDFITQVKYGMLTTKQSEGDYLASRCMALAATVRTKHIHPNTTNINTIFYRNTAASI